MSAIAGEPSPSTAPVSSGSTDTGANSEANASAPVDEGNDESTGDESPVPLEAGEDLPTRSSFHDAVSGLSNASEQSIFRYATPGEAWREIKSSIEADRIVYPHLRIHLPDINSLQKLREHFRSKGISTTSALDDVAAIRQLRNYALIVGSSIGLITLISAMCSIFNTLLASVERRTQEIGILRALGASTPSVLLVFLLEGIINALIGGILATVVVYFGTLTANEWIIERLATNPEFERLVELKPQLFAYPAWLPVVVIGVGLIASLFAALPSAIKACAMQPSSALRHT